MVNNQQQQDSSDWIFYAVIFVAGLFLLIKLVTPIYYAAWYYGLWIEAHFANIYSFGELRSMTLDILAWLKSTNPGQLNAAVIDNVSERYSRFLWHRWILSAVCLWLAWALYEKRSAYNGSPTIDGLLKTEHRIWPALEFVKRVNFIRDFKELSGPCRYQEWPVVFASNNNIIKNFIKTIRETKDRRIYDFSQARAVFTAQLGKKVSRYKDLPGPAKLLIVLAVARDLPKDYPEYNELLRAVNIELAKIKCSSDELEKFACIFCDPVMEILDGEYWSISIKTMLKNQNFANFYNRIAGAGKADKSVDLSILQQFSGTTFKAGEGNSSHIPLIESLLRAIEKQHMRDAFNIRVSRETTYSIYRKIMRSHAFSNTLVVRACYTAGRNGKFPPGRLVCFRPWDRTMYFAISAAPYYSASMSDINDYLEYPSEIIGCMAHFFKELLTGHRIENPTIDRAVVGLHDKLVKQNVLVDQIDKLNK